MPHHHTKPVQFDLFALSDNAKAMTTPDWQALPVRTRRKITGLMARLLVEHALEQRKGSGEGSPVPAGEKGDV